MSKPYNYEGKNYALIPLVKADFGCDGCAFDTDPSGCLSAPDCGSRSIFVEAVEVPEEDDFLAGVKACDLSGDTPCESCQ